MTLFAGVLTAVVLISGLVLAMLSQQLSLPILDTAPCAPADRDRPIDTYEPMLRLLNQDDLRFLRTRSDYTRKLEAKFRAERCRLFRTYLRSLRGDFSRTCGAVKLVMLQSQIDRPDLVSLLLRSRFSFVYRLAIIHVNVAFYRFGIGTVDCSALLAPFRSVRTALDLLTPIPEATAA